ncbi:HEPN domain-containing protein [Aeromonas allosaccharophila]|uniref:hypothetical protein n=1 Tax=Aeromonas allosaccharophila TaxID=656 RepID=UPI003007E388
MQKIIEFNLGRYSRLSEISPDEDIKIQSQDDILWQEITNKLSNYCILYKSLSASVEVSWLPVVKHKKALDEVTNRISDQITTETYDSDFLDQFSALYFKKIPLIAKIDIDGTLTESEEAFLPKIILEKYLYDVFMIANLASPGSCDFLNIEFPRKNGHPEKLFLSSYFFECMYMENIKNQSLPIHQLDFDLVMFWYKNVNSTLKTISETNIEKALFSTMHICKRENFDETTIVWIFHALEALFGTKVGEGFSNIINRIALLLELDDKQKEKTKKTLRKMYDFRSSLVHGGYKVPHPIRPVDIDNHIENKIMDNHELCESGFNMIISSIQKMISNNWQDLCINETIQGTPVGSISRQA